MEIYVVQPGDSVDMIAEQFGVSPQQIIQDNQLIYPYELAVGQALSLAGNQCLIPHDDPLGCIGGLEIICILVCAFTLLGKCALCGDLNAGIFRQTSAGIC